MSPREAVDQARQAVENLAAAVAQKRNAADATREAVTRARLAGVTWQSIADELGMSRQAAWERYR